METNKEKLTNFTAINNHILEKMLKTRLTDCEIKILLFIFRQTFGYHRLYANISFSLFADNINHTKRAIIKSTQKLEERNIIINYKKPSGKVNQWGINTKISMWDSELQDTYKIKGNFDQSIVNYRTLGIVNHRTLGSELQDTRDSEPQDTRDSEPQDTYKINNKKNIKKSILKKEEPDPPKKSDLEIQKAIEIFNRNMERLENEETGGTI